MSDFDKDLNPILNFANNDSLAPLVDYIKKAQLSETITISDEYKVYEPNHKLYVNLIEEEIRKFGGNTFMNLWRGEGPSYFEIVKDVAKKLGVRYSPVADIEEVESAILMLIVTKAWEKMNPEEKEGFLKEMGLGFTSIPTALPLVALQAAITASGFVAYKFAIIVANAIAKFILGRGLTFGGNIILARSVALFAGPIGWAVTGLWTLVDIAGPAYRVTIPSVIHIAMLRQEYKLENAPIAL